MKLKQIEPNEEFIFSGFVFTAYLEESKVKFKLLRKHDKKTKKGFVSPLPQEVIAYFNEKGYTQVAACKFFEYYSAAEWKDANGKQVLNWKQKAVGIWFKDENKIKEVNNKSQMIR